MRALAIIIGIVIVVGLVIGLTPQATWDYLKSFVEIGTRELLTFMKGILDAIKDGIQDSTSGTVVAMVVNFGG